MFKTFFQKVLIPKMRVFSKHKVKKAVKSRRLTARNRFYTVSDLRRRGRSVVFFTLIKLYYLKTSFIFLGEREIFI